MTTPHPASPVRVAAFVIVRGPDGREHHTMVEYSGGEYVAGQVGRLQPVGLDSVGILDALPAWLRPDIDAAAAAD